MHDGKRWRLIFRDSATQSGRRTLVLAPTQATAQALNLAIHAALQMTGSIAKENKEITFLLPHFLRPAEQHNASHYKVGQWIRFHQDYHSARVHRGEYRRIEGIDQKTNELLLANDRGSDPALESGQSEGWCC